MASPRRIEKIQGLLKEEIAKILDHEIEWPEGTMVTVTRVVLSSDVHYATVMVSVWGRELEHVMKMLQRTIPSLQRILNRKVRMRPVPKIRFMLDEGEARRESIEQSLAELKRKGEV